MGLYLVRHGETEWSRSGRHTSVTDLPLLPEGERGAKELAPRLAGIEFAQILTSPRRRARQTAELAGFPGAVVDEDLVEWNYGEYEGVTTPEIHQRNPGWSVWEGVTPGGETPAEITTRLDRVIARVRGANGDTLVFGHSHCLRALAARWLGEPVSIGRFFWLGTSTLSMLGEDRGTPVVRLWNA